MARRHEKAKEYTRRYQDSLLPCRYCGNTKIVILSDRTIFNPHNVWSVSCPECGDCVYGATTVKEAVEKWNNSAKKVISYE